MELILTVSEFKYLIIYYFIWFKSKMLNNYYELGFKITILIQMI